LAIEDKVGLKNGGMPISKLLTEYVDAERLYLL
jgi:hypothetical protein